MKGKPLTDFDIVEKLLVEYPDKNIIDFFARFKNNNTVVQYVRRKSKEKGVSIEQYLKDLGFTLNKRRNYTTFVERLLKKYPDKIIRDNLTSLPFYSSISNMAYKLNVNPTKYILSLGFKIKKESKK